MSSDCMYSAGKWEDVNGKVWAISDMETSHIKACINLLKKDSGVRYTGSMGDPYDTDTWYCESYDVQDYIDEKIKQFESELILRGRLLR